MTYLATMEPYCLTLNPSPHAPVGCEFKTLLSLSELLRSLSQVLTSQIRLGLLGGEDLVCCWV